MKRVWIRGPRQGRSPCWGKEKQGSGRRFRRRRKRSIADFATTLWPVFLLVVPMGVAGAVEQGAALGWMALAFGSVLVGGWMARKGGALL